MITLIIILIISLIIADLILIDSKRQLAEQKRQKLIERTMQSPFGDWRRERENERNKDKRDDYFKLQRH